MVTLNIRTRNILILILKSPGPISSKEIASTLGITPRMVMYCSQTIELWLQERGFQLTKTPGSGFFIDLPDELRDAYIQELAGLSGYSLVLNPIDREYFIILSLLTEAEPVLIKQLANELGVSHPTLLKDMDRVQERLSGYDIILIRRPGFGFKVEGAEWNYRKVIEDIVLDVVGEMSLLALCQGRQSKLLVRLDERIRFMRMASSPLDRLELNYALELVDTIEGMSRFQFSDSSFIDLLLVLAILIERVRTGHTINELSNTYTNLVNEKEYQIAKVIAVLIHQKYQIELSTFDQIYIIVRLMGIKNRQSITTITEELIPGPGNDEADAVVKDLVSTASKLLHPYLTVDQPLIRGLTIHIKPTLNRLRFNLTIRNALLDEIKSQYPYIYHVAEVSCATIEARIGKPIPEAEVGYIAMHLGAAMERLRSFSVRRWKVCVVCGAGTATSWMLVSRLQAELPEIEVVQVLSSMELTRGRTSIAGIDALISVVPLDPQDIPVIQVTPLLNDADMKKIRESLAPGRPQLNYHPNPDIEQGISLQELLTEDTVRYCVKARTWKETIAVAARPLLETGAIENSYLEGIADLLVKFGPYMVLVPGIALLHGLIGSGVNRVCMSLCTLDEPVQFGNPHNDPVYIAIVFGSIDNTSHLRALAQLSRLLGKEDLIQSLKRAGSQAELLRILRAAAM